MDIYEYLKMDHKKVAHLFDLFEDSNMESHRKEIVFLITQELLVHAHSEEETFYKKLAHFPLTQGMASHGKEEHQEIEDQIMLVMNTSLTGKKWESEVLKLKKLVDHHVKEEESEIFKKAKKVLTEKEACVLKEKMHYLKGKLMLILTKPQRSTDKFARSA